MALSKFGLDALMSICLTNACKCRFLFGPLKWIVVVYNESKNVFLKSDREWYLGHHRINEGERTKSKRKAKHRNWSNQKANSALKTKTGNK